eukprot:COSAG02_NODE_143_length_34133_cov_272.981282_2_plen_302_part_00
MKNLEIRLSDPAAAETFDVRILSRRCATWSLGCAVPLALWGSPCARLPETLIEPRARDHMGRWGPRMCGERPGRALVLARTVLAVFMRTVALLLEHVWGCTRPIGGTRARISAPSELKPHQVFVKTLSGRSIALRVGDGTVAGLQRLVSAREGISSAEQRLTYAGRDLGDGALLLAECGIPRNATLHLSLRLRGGMELGKLLMCAQAFHMVWPTVREFFRSCWNGCAKPENQCPVRPPRVPPGVLQSSLIYLPWFLSRKLTHWCVCSHVASSCVRILKRRSQKMRNRPNPRAGLLYGKASL